MGFSKPAQVHPVRDLRPGVFISITFQTVNMPESSRPISLLAALVLLTQTASQAQPSGEAGSTVSQAIASAVPSSAGAHSRPHPVTLAAAQQGVLACSARINQVANFLGVDEKSSAMLILAPAQQDQRFASVVLEMPSPSTGSSAYVSAMFAPNQANGCGAGYESVAYWPKSCNEVGRQNFSSLKTLGRLKTDITVLDGGSQLKVFLLPAGTGCVSIKKEVIL